MIAPVGRVVIGDLELRRISCSDGEIVSVVVTTPIAGRVQSALLVPLELVEPLRVALEYICGGRS